MTAGLPQGGADMLLTGVKAQCSSPPCTQSSTGLPAFPAPHIMYSQGFTPKKPILPIWFPHHLPSKLQLTWPKF